jgi:hypothetical protein
MFKKIAAYIAIALSLAVLVVSTSKDCMSYIYEKRITGAPDGKWYSPYRPKGGDLTAIAYLDQISKFVEPESYKFPKADDSGTANVRLLLFGDSYVKDIPDSAFAGVNEFQFGRRGYSNIGYYKDSTKRTVLIIEIGERFLRDYFSIPFIFKQVALKKQPIAAIIPLKPFTPRTNYAAFELPDLGFVDSFFNKNINQNIEQNVFNYGFINPIRTAKATFTYSVFNRASGDVVISKDGEHLFVKESAITTGKPSSYTEISKHELFVIVNNINTIYDSYTKRGIDDVYLSIIPNPASILQPEGYNNLIPKIQHHPGMKVPYINVYDVFKTDKNPARFYRQGDTHWNNTGLQIWLSMVNAELRKQNRNTK